MTLSNHLSLFAETRRSAMHRMPSHPTYQQLPYLGSSQDDPTITFGLSAAHMSLPHGTTTQGAYESSAFFIRLDHRDSTRSALKVDESAGLNRPERFSEFLFCGDMGNTCRESTGNPTEEMEKTVYGVWKAAAEKWDQRRLRAIFVSASRSGTFEMVNAC